MEDKYFDFVLEDFKNGPDNPKHIISKATALAYERFKNGQLAIAFTSLDNCSHNGQKLHDSILTIAKAWADNSLVEEEFLPYLKDESKVSFLWFMIDKITPGPSQIVKEKLEKIDFKDTEIIETNKNTQISAFVNAEAPEYLVIEDEFPNGKISIDKVGVIYTDRETVKYGRNNEGYNLFKSFTYSNGSIWLFYTSIAEEMRDDVIRELIKKIGYKEGLPVVVNPGVLNFKAFIDEVVEERLSNSYIPDTPQRIAKDTSKGF